MTATATPVPTRAELKLVRSRQMFDQRIHAAGDPDKAWAAIVGELRAVYKDATPEERALLAATVRDVSRSQRARAGSRARRRRVRAA